MLSLLEERRVDLDLCANVGVGVAGIVEDGRPCSCGRRGCLEAYVSVTALHRETQEKLGRPMEWEELWKTASEGDETAKELAEGYIRRLSTGVVNLVNILHPKLVVIGGNLAAYGETWLEPLKESVLSKTFGGTHSVTPEIKAGTLGRKAGTLGAANLT